MVLPLASIYLLSLLLLGFFWFFASLLPSHDLSSLSNQKQKPVSWSETLQLVLTLFSTLQCRCMEGKHHCITSVRGKGTSGILVGYYLVI